MTFRSDPQALDAADPLARFRAAFVRPDGVLYLCGHSLGAAPKAAADRMARAVGEEWAQSLVRGWNSHDWIGAARRVGDRIAPLVGAAPGEVIVADSTSVNLYKLVVAALHAAPERPVVLALDGEFPTDRYILEGVLRAVPGARLETGDPAWMLSRLDADVGVAVASLVDYRTAEVRDMARFEAAAQAAGASIVWDLSHAAGAVGVDLNGAGATLAVGCGYKYLNGGPGAPGYLYVAAARQAGLVSPLQGWMGHAAPFAFADAYSPAAGIDRFACGTPPILSLTALECGAAVVAEAGAAAIAAKTRALVALFLERAGGGLELASSAEPDRRGGHVAFRHPDAYAIVQALMARGVVGDFRAPDVMRFGFSALPLSFAEVARAADLLVEVVETRAYDDPKFWIRAKVT